MVCCYPSSTSSIICMPSVSISRYLLRSISSVRAKASSTNLQSTWNILGTFRIHHCNHHNWDVIQHIVTALCLLVPNWPHLVHVKAHQYDAASFDDLPVQSQLNVQANTLPEDYNASSSHLCHSSAPMQHSQAPLLWTNNHVLIPKHSLPASKTKSLKEISGLLLKWTWFIGKLTAKPSSTFLIKLLRNKFPAGRTIADYKDATYDHQCPSCCQEEYEDGTHFLHCSHPNSIK